MNDLDMELQTIRQKLQTLKASPPETMTSPWNPSRLTAPSPNLAQVTTAIETLRQRSGQTLSSNADSPSLQQFDAALTAVDQLAQQQHQALQRLHALGNNLIQQANPGTSPDIDDIARFLEAYQSIQIPTVQRDTDGYLDLRYHTVHLQPAEYGSDSHTDTWNMRSQLFQHPLGQPTRPINPETLDESPYDNNHFDNLLGDLQHFWQISKRTFQRWTNHHIPSAPRGRNPNFTLLDGAIWCIGAVIARIILNQIFQFYPALWTPVACMVIAGIIFTLYRSIFSPRPNPLVGYRTLMIIIGLLIGGRFS
ncbi:MAG: hypothetical protein KTR27_21710 [Leptolyngbyaceae cyanobacterium MAG.088]|nr:hypothetical protein [Leptolyngbyaceae cyanobacterium MAG.088]